MSTRRSRSIRLALMGSIGLVGTLPGCDEAPQADAFASVEECIARTGQDLTCREGFAQSQTQVGATAPAFRSREACEAVFTNCAVPPAGSHVTSDQVNAANDAVASTPGAPPNTSASTGSSTGSWFMPAAAGFLLGRATSGLGGSPYFMRRDGGAVGFAGGQAAAIDPRAFAQQQQQQRQSNWSSSGSGSRISSRGTYTPAPSPRSGSAASTGSISRSGGFGSSARASSGSSSGG